MFVVFASLNTTLTRQPRTTTTTTATPPHDAVDAAPLAVSTTAMAQRITAPSVGGQGGGEKSLDYFDEKTPPGWMPGIASYPFVQYQKKLELWIMRYRLAGLPPEQEAPAMASRLHGQPWEIAMKLRIPKSVADGGPRPGAGVTTPAATPDQYHTGPQALVQPEVTEQTHGVYRNVYLQDCSCSGQPSRSAMDSRPLSRRPYTLICSSTFEDAALVCRTMC